MNQIDYIELSDKDFILNFFHLNMSYKFHVSGMIMKFLEEKKCSNSYYKTAYLQLFENYVQLTECILMILYSFKKMKEDNSTFLFEYRKMAINENDSTKNTQSILDSIQNLSAEEFIIYFKLEFFEKEFLSLEPEKRAELIEMFGGYDKTVEQFLTEINHLKTNIYHIFKSRTSTDGDVLSFTQMYNKIKHGFTFNVQNEIDEFIEFFKDVKVKSLNTNLVKIDRIGCKEDTLKIFYEKIELLKNVGQHLLSCIYFSL